MAANLNALQWQGQGGHYEVYYLTVTEPRSGVGFWIRYTMLASQRGEFSCALWFIATDPRSRTKVARKRTMPIASLQVRPAPFELRLDEALLSDEGMAGALGDVEWELRWAAPGGAYEHVHPLLRRVGAAQTVLVLPHADLSISGHVVLCGERIELEAARGGQAHLWGTKHATRWTWAHCNDFVTESGYPAPGAFVDGVSVIVRRLGLQLGPNTPLVGRINDQKFASTSPARVISNSSRFELTSWRFEALERDRKVIGEVEVDRELLAGVTYEDPDGELAYCYNSEAASMRVEVYERTGRPRSWVRRETLVAPGRAHFEYAQRTPIDGLELLIR